MQKLLVVQKPKQCKLQQFLLQRFIVRFGRRPSRSSVFWSQLLRHQHRPRKGIDNHIADAVLVHPPRGGSENDQFGKAKPPAVNVIIPVRMVVVKEGHQGARNAPPIHIKAKRLQDTNNNVVRTANVGAHPSGTKGRFGQSVVDKRRGQGPQMQYLGQFGIWLNRSKNSQPFMSPITRSRSMISGTSLFCSKSELNVSKLSCTPSHVIIVLG